MIKTYNSHLQVKSEKMGTIECVFATLETWDHDNDFTQKGAFGRQDNIAMEGWGHDTSLPVGEGYIFERGTDAVFKGFFYLNTQNGRDHFEIISKRAAHQQFSYTFNILDATQAKNNGRSGRILKKLDVYGVGAVTRGAGLGTRVLSIKGRNHRHSPSMMLIDEIEMVLLKNQILADGAEILAENGRPRGTTKAAAYINHLVDEGMSPRLAAAWLASKRQSLVNQVENSNEAIAWSFPGAAWQLVDRYLNT